MREYHIGFASELIDVGLYHNLFSNEWKTQKPECRDQLGMKNFLSSCLFSVFWSLSTPIKNAAVAWKPVTLCFRASCLKPTHRGLRSSALQRRTVYPRCEQLSMSCLFPFSSRTALFDNMADAKIIESNSCLLEYLGACREYIQRNSHQREWRMNVTNKDRKTIIRTLLGDGRWSKAEFKAKLKDFSTKNQWESTKHFLDENLDELKCLANRLQERDDLLAPTPFQAGLEDYCRFENQPPAKLFSYMARGRRYQGQFGKLLGDLDKSEWLETYKSIVREKEDIALVAEYVDDFIANSSLFEDRAQRHKSLQKALTMDMPDAPSQPTDGGKQSGVQGELDLMTYLEQANSNLDADEVQCCKILAPVFLQNQRRGRRPNKKCPYVIEMPADIDLHGKASEFDALVVSISPKELTIHQVWEAKATLHPMTIRDALAKKGRTLSYLVPSHRRDYEIPEPVLFQINGESHVIDDTSSPRFGIFGRRLLQPMQGVNRMVTFLGEALIDSSPEAVEQALIQAYVSVSEEQLIDEIESIMKLAKQLNATLVISSDLATSCWEAQP